MEQTVQEYWREFVRIAQERINRELRYHPQLTGKVTFTCKFRAGTPFALEIAVDEARLIEPIKKS